MTLFSNLRGDIFGGITAAIVALPMALAFGVASGAGPLAGLYGAIFVGLFAALFGGTPAQVSGPTGPMTVVMAILFTRFAHEPAMVFTVVMLGGLFQVLFGLLRFGRYINLVPYPVISGFMSGIGCIIIILQLAPFFGHSPSSSAILERVAGLPSVIGNPVMQALVPGTIALAIVYLTPARIRQYIPPAIIALIISSVAAMLWFPLAPVIGEIPSGLPQIRVPDFTLADFPLIIRYALILAFLGSIDSLLTSLVADSMTRTHHDSDRELIGQGIGNFTSGMFGGIPGAGATMRTVVNIRSGGRTPLSGAVHALVLFLIVIGFSGLVSHVPHAVLAGILIKVGIDIIDWRYLKRVTRAPKAGVFIMLTTLVLTVAVDLITAVAAGMIMASVLFVKRMADAQMQSMKLIFDPGHVDDLTPEESEILERAGGRIVLFHLEGPMSFGSAKDIARVLRSSVKQDILIIDLSDVPFIDSSASITLEEVIQDIHAQNDIVILCGLRQKVSDVLGKIGVTRLIKSDCILTSRTEALRRADRLLHTP